MGTRQCPRGDGSQPGLRPHGIAAQSQARSLFIGANGAATTLIDCGRQHATERLPNPVSARSLCLAAWQQISISACSRSDSLRYVTASHLWPTDGPRDCSATHTNEKQCVVETKNPRLSRHRRHALPADDFTCFFPFTPAAPSAHPIPSSTTACTAEQLYRKETKLSCATCSASAPQLSLPSLVNHRPRPHEHHLDYLCTPQSDNTTLEPIATSSSTARSGLGTSEQP